MTALTDMSAIKDTSFASNGEKWTDKTLGASSRAAFLVSPSTAALLTAYAGAPGTARFAAAARPHSGVPSSC